MALAKAQQSPGGAPHPSSPEYQKLYGASTGTQALLLYAGIAVAAYFILAPKKKTKSSSGLNGPKGKKRKAGKKKK